jgi:SsrA-binding protein
MSKKTVARNKKALHEYHIIDTYEAGIVLAGPEVKSIRAGKVSLTEAFARVEGSEAFSTACTSRPTTRPAAGTWIPTRTRKLLLHRARSGG